MTRPPGLLCVRAHPDDEVILTGGVLATTVRRGLRAGVVTCTGGEEGEIVGEGIDPDQVRPRLPEVRRAELERSLEILGAGPPRLLGYRDSGMMGTESNGADGAFWRADFDEAVGRLVGEIRRFRPDVLVTDDAYGGYGHPDHIQSHRVAVVAAEAAAVAPLYPEHGPAWRVRKTYLATIPRSAIIEGAREMAARGLPTPFGDLDEREQADFGTDDAEVGAIIDVREAMEAKWAALRAHATQIGPESFFLNVPEDLREVVFGTEYFVRYRSAVPVDGVEDDLFAGVV